MANKRALSLALAAPPVKAAGSKGFGSGMHLLLKSVTLQAVCVQPFAIDMLG